MGILRIFFWQRMLDIEWAQYQLHMIACNLDLSRVEVSKIGHVTARVPLFSPQNLSPSLLIGLNIIPELD